MEQLKWWWAPLKERAFVLHKSTVLSKWEGNQYLGGLLNYTFKTMVSHFVLRASPCKAGLSRRTYSGVILDDCIEIRPFWIMALMMVTDNLHGNGCTLSWLVKMTWVCSSSVSNSSVQSSVTTVFTLWCVHLSICNCSEGSKSPPDTGQSLVTL